MEQKIWYPALAVYPDCQEIIEHLRSEEEGAKEAIKKFKKVRFEFMWSLRFAKFKHDVLHHAKGEEQELFSKAKKVLSKVELMKLGHKMQKFVE
jgi:hemerythrin superfamily protein